MAIDMTPEERTAGQENFEKAKEALGLNRRTFLKAGILGAGAVAGAGAAVYFGYQSLRGNPVRAALIGGGDEGGVLVGEHNPEFLKFVAVCDIRPTNMRRIYEGEPAGLRKGFKRIYGQGVESPRSSDYIRPFDDYDKFLAHLKADKSIEAVVIATPLFLHARMAIDCMKAGEERGKPVHVLCEKLMAWNVRQCKEMLKAAHETGSILAIGHQRHYSMLYSHAQEVVKSKVLGEVRHIRALWHRNFSWPYKHDDKKGRHAKTVPMPTIRDGWYPPVMEEDFDKLYPRVKDLKKEFGYGSIEQLVRWRLYPETGGGLMAELGSHQLDACSIFLGKVRPISVQGVGGRLFFDGPGGKNNPREIDDHVFVTYEFPGENYYERDDKGLIRYSDEKKKKPIVKNKDDKVIVTWSSVSTNGFEKYGECLMGTRGTMVVEAEQSVMLYTEKEPGKKGDQRKMEVSVSALKAAAAAADSSSTWGGPPTANVTASSGAASASGPVSRGYREEMEDFAYCVRNWDANKARESTTNYYAQRLPRCHGQVAMADAIIALAANEAMKKHTRLEFDHGWFEMQEKDFDLPDWDTEKKSAIKEA